jgi:hypothetical protein
VYPVHILLFVIFVVTTDLLAIHSSGIYAEDGGFWSLSTKMLGIPLFQAVRGIFVIVEQLDYDT